MDYTIRPQNNLAPGQFNFDLLNQLYSTSPETVNDSSTVPDVEQPPPLVQPPADKDEKKKKEEDEKDEDDRRERVRRLEDSIPSDSYKIYKIAREAIEENEGVKETLSLEDVDTVQAGQHNEFYHVDLGNDYTMVVDKLLDESRWNFQG